MFEVCNINNNEDAKRYYKGIESILYYNFIRLVRSDGTVLKKDGTKITAKEFLENIVLIVLIKKALQAVKEKLQKKKKQEN